MTAPRNQNGGHYRRRFVNWNERPSSSPAALNAAKDTTETVRKLNEWLDEHQAAGVVSEAVGLCAAEARRQAAQAAAQAEGWGGGDPGE
uniref:hypothetical protein n=1 Tax=Paractinoplanes polyasparticus TaxID=2856853 RepID=UPI001C85CFB1|nr:hypothetical protein [Actinoplanes polyasparticus]